MKRFGISAALALALIAVSVPVGAERHRRTATGPTGSVHARRRVGRRHAVPRGPLDACQRAAEGDGRGLLEPVVLGLEVVHRASSGRPRPGTSRSRSTRSTCGRDCRYWYRFKASPNDSSHNVTYQRGRDVQDRAVDVAQVERRVHLGRRLRDESRRRRQPVQQLGGAGPRARGERRLLRLPRRHDLLGLQLPAGRPGEHAATSTATPTRRVAPTRR